MHGDQHVLIVVAVLVICYYLAAVQNTPCSSINTTLNTFSNVVTMTL